MSRTASEQLNLRYRIDGDIDRLLIPGPGPGTRQNALWKHTCFEAFAKIGPSVDSASPAYYEFNFAPSGDWAAYRFDGYRSGMADAGIAAAPAILVSRTRSRLEVDVTFTLPLEIAGTPPVSLTAVIEDAAGRISYWAVAHAPLKPDFHHDNGFVLRLPP